MPSGYKHVALYFGSLYGEWFAWDYLFVAAAANPDMAFVLIGELPEGKSLPVNVHAIGRKNIEDLPAYLAYADMGLLPFVPGQISDAVSPIKVFEYLFSGTPVVSTRLPELDGYPGVLVAHSPEEFASICSSIPKAGSAPADNDLFISRNSWFSRLDAIAGNERRQKFKESVSAVILIHNNKQIIGRCLETLLSHCAFYLKEVIVVDNASSDGGAEYVERRFQNVKLIRNAENGCSSGRNLGAQHVSGRFIAFFDSDQWFTSSSAFAEALSILDRDANIGAVGWGAGWFDASRSDLTGRIADYSPNRAMNAAAIAKGYRSDIGYLGTCGMFMLRSVFDNSDGFDVAYDPTCFEDTDLSFQIKRLGLDVCFRDLCGIRHQPHQTTCANHNSDKYKNLFDRNANYFKQKWSDFPHFFVDYTE
jgi:GT2 family glycosyltransferase